MSNENQTHRDEHKAGLRVDELGASLNAEPTGLSLVIEKLGAIIV